VLEQTARSADQHVRILAHQCRLDLEVFTAGDQCAPQKGVAGKALDLLEGLLRQLTGRQQDQRASPRRTPFLGQQTV